MLLLFRYTCCCLFAVWLPVIIAAQSGPRVPKAVSTLFDDLPVNDASAKSVLNGTETVASKIAGNIFVTASLNTNHCFWGEPVLFTVYLYSALQSQSAIAAMPKLPGFLVTDMPVSNDTPQYKIIGNKQYRVFAMRRLQLLPVQAGVVTLDPLVVNNSIQYTDDNNHEHTYTGIVKSNPVRLTVMPLPDKNKPLSFSGLIGSFSLKANVTSLQIEAGATDTLQLEIEGAGNFTDCVLPEWHWPADVEAFTAKEQMNIDEENSFPAKGKKCIAIPFIVARPGKLELPAIKMSYFDPASGKYKTLVSKPIALNVLPATARKPIVTAAPKAGYNWIGTTVLVLLIPAVYFGWQRRRKNKQKNTPPTNV